MIPGVMAVRNQAAAQNQWALSLAFAEPGVLYAILAVGAAGLLQNLGQLGDVSMEMIGMRKTSGSYMLPDFLQYKLEAIRSLNISLCKREEAIRPSTIFTVMCLLAIEVRYCEMHKNSCMRRINFSTFPRSSLTDRVGGVLRALPEASPILRHM